MIGDDDWASFYDPDEFGCELQLVLGGDVREVPGMLGAPREPDQLRTGNRNQGGVRAKPGEIIAQVPRSELPSDWAKRQVFLDGKIYTAVEAIPIGRIRVGLVLIPYSEREKTHGEWLRG